MSFSYFLHLFVTCRWLSHRIRDLRKNLGFLDFPPFIEINGVNFDVHNHGLKKRETRKEDNMINNFKRVKYEDSMINNFKRVKRGFGFLLQNV